MSGRIVNPSYKEETKTRTLASFFQFKNIMTPKNYRNLKILYKI